MERAASRRAHANTASNNGVAQGALCAAALRMPRARIVRRTSLGPERSCVRDAARSPGRSTAARVSRHNFDVAGSAA